MVERPWKFLGKLASNVILVFANFQRGKYGGVANAANLPACAADVRQDRGGCCPPSLQDSRPLSLALPQIPFRSQFAHVDVRHPAGDDVGQHLGRAAGHGPAERAVAGVEIEIGVARCGRSAAGRPASSAAARTRRSLRACRRRPGKRSPTECSSVRAPRFMQPEVEAGNLGRAADADAVAEPGDRHLVGFVHHRRHRCARRHR